MTQTGTQTATAGNGGLGVRLALLGAAMALAAVNTGNNLIYLMLSLVLALALVGAIAGRRAARRLSVEAHLPPEVRAAEPFTIHFEAKGRFPLLPRALVVARLEGLPSIVEIPISVPALDARAVASARVTIEKRGIHENLEVKARTGYPFNLAWMRARARKTGGVVVLPSFMPLRAMQVAAAHASPLVARAEAIAARGSGTEVLDLREYAPEDDARHIDWRSSARARHAKGTAPTPARVAATIPARPAFSALRRICFDSLSFVLMNYLLVCARVRVTARRL